MVTVDLLIDNPHLSFNLVTEHHSSSSIVGEIVTLEIHFLFPV